MEKSAESFNQRSTGINSTRAISIVEKLSQSQQSFERKDWKKRGIYRVPWALNINNDGTAFRPRLVSIGPYHYGDPRLEAMQFHKYRMLHTILKRTGKQINVFLEVVKELEDNARACYQDLIDQTCSFSSESFVELLVLDACFILDFLVGFQKLPYHQLGYDEDDPVFSKFYICTGIVTDMILLENQVPLFILNAIYEVLFDCPHNDVVVDMMLRVFDSALVIGRELRSDEGGLFSSGLKSGAGTDIQSCLELFWHNLMYDSDSNKYTTKMVQERRVQDKVVNLKQFVIPSVTALKEAGVTLKHKNTTPFWDIDFNAGVLNIPQIMIYEMSESIFLNLMAFELCHLDDKKYKILPYVVFMDSLVNSASDVAKLRAHGIIVCAGPSDEQVADLFNRLGMRVVIPFDQFIPTHQFVELSHKIYQHCNQRRHRWRANLMRNYFSSPWTIISVIAAAFLVLLTIVQTCYTIAQYYQK